MGSVAIRLEQDFHHAASSAAKPKRNSRKGSNHESHEEDDVKSVNVVLQLAHRAAPPGFVGVGVIQLLNFLCQEDLFRLHRRQFERFAKVFHRRLAMI